MREPPDPREQVLIDNWIAVVDHWVECESPPPMSMELATRLDIEVFVKAIRYLMAGDRTKDKLVISSVVKLCKVLLQRLGGDQTVSMAELIGSSVYEIDIIDLPTRSKKLVLRRRDSH